MQNHFIKKKIRRIAERIFRKIREKSGIGRYRDIQDVTKGGQHQPNLKTSLMESYRYSNPQKFPVSLTVGNIYPKFTVSLMMGKINPKFSSDIP